MGVISCYMEDPTLTLAKKILLYVKETLSYGLFYGATNDFKMCGFSDSD